MTGRRGLAVMLTALTAIALLAPSVLAAEETVEDKFEGSSYSGGSGWTSNWTETGESTNPSSGVIQVVSSGCDGSNCVRFSSILTLGAGLQRSANFEGAESISLTFRYRKAGVGNLEVRARTGSGSWQGVATLGNSSAYTNATIDLSDYASPTMQIMFFSTLGLLSSAHIDNVLITASYPTTTTSTTTTTTATSTTTTTTEPTVTLPTVTVPPLLTTTTTASSSTTTTTTSSSPTTTAASSSTTTTTGGTGTSTTTRTGPPGTGGGGMGSPPGGGSGDGDQATDNLPLTEEQLDFAAESNIVVNLVGEGDFGGFEPGIGINPMTDLWVNLNTTVEAISTEILSALTLGAMIAFFGVRRVTDDDAVPQT